MHTPERRLLVASLVPPLAFLLALTVGFVETSLRDARGPVSLLSDAILFAVILFTGLWCARHLRESEDRHVLSVLGVGGAGIFGLATLGLAAAWWLVPAH